MSLTNHKQTKLRTASSPLKNSFIILLLLCINSVFSQQKALPINSYNCKTKLDDVSINEILADPNPPIALPKAKFIELKNNTNQTISLKNWVYSDINNHFTFKNDSIKANEYLIICAEKNTDKFRSYGRVIGISQQPSPRGSGDRLSIRNECGTIINHVNYTDTWYRNSSKKKGGWTLELINPKASSSCAGMQNWDASTDASGGTPGRQNSIYGISPEPLKVTQAILLDDTSILLSFNHTIEQNSASIVSNYTLNNGIGIPLSAIPTSPYFECVRLTFSTPISNGNSYQITAQNIRDCAGNKLSNKDNSAELTLTKQITKGDILINEVLFNPNQDGVDFVELYNHSSNPLNLKDLFLIATNKNGLPKLYPITKETYLLKAKHYLVLSTDPDKIKQHYHTENTNAFLKMESLPAFNNGAGAVILISDSVRIDQFDYADNMHSKLIKDRNGVSLERVSFQHPTNEPGNFKSASSAVGFATPGYKNSQYLDPNRSEEGFSLASKTFSPNADGFEDTLQINYKFAAPTGAATIRIFSNLGVPIKKLINNQTLAAEGMIHWDGLNERNERAAVGIYIIYAEVFDLNGNVRKYRKSCVLATQLD